MIYFSSFYISIFIVLKAKKKTFEDTLFKLWSADQLPGPSPGSLLEMQILGAFSRGTESEFAF